MKIIIPTVVAVIVIVTFVLIRNQYVQKKVDAATISVSVTSGQVDSTVANSTFSGSSVTLPFGRSGDDPAENLIYFDNLGVPQGANITSANMDFTIIASGGSDVNVKVSAIDVISPTLPTDLATFQALAVQQTTSFVDWNLLPSGSWGDILSSPDISTIVQEVVNDPSWTTGSGILIKIADNGSSGYSRREVVSGDFSGGEAKPKITVTYSEVNNLPTANPDTATTNSAATINVLENDTDSDIDDVLSIVSVADPTHGTAQIVGDTITYQVDDGYVGEDVFEYTISDGEATATSTITITVVQAGISFRYDFSINRTNVPDLYYNDLTVGINIEESTSYELKVDNVVITPEYDNATDMIYFTTTGTNVSLTLNNPVNPGEVAPQKIALKDNKLVAWSHGMDDNVFLEAQIALLDAKGWPGTLNLIGNIVDETRVEGWVIDKPDIISLLDSGWGLGNHAWDGSCPPPSDQIEAQILNGYNRLNGIIADSNKPEYKLIGFAAPCFLADYDPFIEDMRASGATDVLFNESQGDGLMIVDIGASTYAQSPYTAVPMNSSIVKIGRNTDLSVNPAVAVAKLDRMFANASNTRHFWFNTLTHGNNEADLTILLDHAYNTYGPAGTDTIWAAPSSEIYSYLVVRDNVTFDSFLTIPISDGTAPEMTSLEENAITTTTAEVDWVANRSISGELQISLVDDVSYATDAYALNPGASGTVAIPDLKACTDYFYKINFTDIYDVTNTTAVSSFRTTGCSSDYTITDLLQTTVNPASTSTLVFDNDGSSVEAVFPELFIDNPVLINISRITLPSESEILTANVFKVIGQNGFLIRAYRDNHTEVISFDQPITLTIDYLDADVLGLKSDTAVVNSLNGTTLSALTCTNGTLTIQCEVTNTGNYLLLAEVSDTVVPPTTNTNTVVTPPSVTTPTSLSPLCDDRDDSDLPYTIIVEKEIEKSDCLVEDKDCDCDKSVVVETSDDSASNAKVVSVLLLTSASSASIALLAQRYFYKKKGKLL